ncbi:twin-arginine translocation pathway signal [Mycolicibacter sinensis]|nr:twin-arginine translocation pathway signal [Mycolicibacter sinensis]
MTAATLPLVTRSVSRREALRYATLLVPALAVPGVLGAMAGAPTAAADGLQLIDFADRLVQPEQIRAAGFAGALVYVSELRPGATFDFKPVTRDYADRLRAAGLQVVSCYQFGKPGWANSPSDFTRGYDGGVADARTALRLHSAAGGPDSAPIFFSVDEDIDAKTWKGLALHWFRGINSVLGDERTGIYGGARQLGWAIADGVVGHSTSPGYRWAWQTKAWSGGEREPAAVLFQREVVTATDPGFMIDDIHVDVDDVLAADFGQWDLTR